MRGPGRSDCRTEWTFGGVLVDLVVALVIAFALIGISTLAIGGTVDALRQPAAAWADCGYRRATWAWQALGALVLPIGLVCSGIYFLRVRPRLIAATPRLIAQPYEQAVWQLMLAGPVPASSPNSVRIRIPREVNVLSALLALLALAFNLVLGSIDQAYSDRRLAALSIGLGALLVLMIALGMWVGITLTPEGVLVHNIRRRRLAWNLIEAVTEEPRFGSRRVVLWIEGGYRVPLRAPVMALPGVGRRRFEQDFHTIGRWWLAHGAGSGQAGQTGQTG